MLVVVSTTPASRLLTLLEMLQARPSTNGSDWPKRST